MAPAERARLLVEAMTIDEKIEQIALNTGPNPGLPGCGLRRDTRHVEGIARLGLPTFRYTNGPIGVAGGDCNPNPPTTAVPTALLVASTWDGNASFRWGEIAGIETRNIAHQVFEAPGINMGRVPQAGRNFEYFGEDPFLSGSMAIQQVKAIQSQGTQATLKHFVANEQEIDRISMNTIVDDRTMHELYMLPFEMAIRDADPASIICSYPKVAGVFACESRQLLSDVLRQQWGFRGYVISDRKALHSTAPAIKAGLDLEFDNTAVWFTPEKIKAALAAGQITVSDIDTMLKRRFYPMFSLGQFDAPAESFTAVDFEAHAETARTIAEQGSVLLKNENGALPLAAASLRSIALIGVSTFGGAAKLPTTGPKGIITVNAPHLVTPLQGLNSALRKLGSPAAVTFDDGSDLARAKALAAKSDVAIVMAGDISLEGEDRPNLSLPVINGVNQDELIAAIATANPRTILVLKDGGPVLMPWLARVPAVLEAWYPGQEDGIAVADLLFGIVNPSGKLPITFPAAEREGVVSSEAQYPGVMVGGVRTVTYSEGLQMGYRWYDSHKIAPQFPFGFGLSYTRFALSQLKVTKETDGTKPVLVQFMVQNTGKRAGAEVPQVYLGLPASTGEPPKRLVAFQKVSLAPGERKRIELALDPLASNHPFGYWDSNSQRWMIANGQYEISVGDSSANMVLQDVVKVSQPIPAGEK
jgi:beta-glucosidase